MKNKRILPLLLALLMVSLPAFAGAISIKDYFDLSVEEVPADLAIVEDSMFLMPDFEGFSVMYSAIIENRSDFQASLSDASLELLDKEGQAVASERIYISTPYLIPAKGKAVVQTGYTIISQEQKQQVASHRLSLSGVKGSDYSRNLDLPVTVAYVEGSEPDYGAIDYSALNIEEKTRPVGSYVATVENNQNMDVYELTTVVILRDQNGRLALVRTNSPYDVGFPPGGKMLVRGSVPGSFLALLAQDGITIGSAEAWAYVSQDIPLDELE